MSSVGFKGILTFKEVRLFCILHCLLIKVEGVKCRASFMSERDSFYLGSIGLLGEYCPTSRKKYICSLDRVGCIHLEPFRDSELIQGCNWEQPFPLASDQFHSEEASHSSSLLHQSLAPAFATSEIASSLYF